MPKRFFLSLFLLATLLLLNPTASQADNNDTNKSKTNSFDQSLISQLASQNMAESVSTFSPFSQILNGLDNTVNTSEIYQSIRQFWYQDISGIFFNGIAQAINQFFQDLRNSYLPLTVIYLSNAIKQFFLNTDLTKIQNASPNSHDLTFLLKQFNETIFGIALDLSLLLFILSIWRYWVDSAWKGSGNLMSPVARLIFAIGLLLAWPTIYSFQIQLSNELMNALFIDNNGNIQLLDLGMSGLFENLFSVSLFATGVFSINSSFFVETLVPFIQILLPIVFCLLAIVLIYELVYVVILKAIQSALMTAQYVFAPVFLVLLTNPVTDNIATSYIRTFVEVSLWNFIWIGLLKILVILLYSNLNPWGKILTAIGILQIMMDVPQFLAHAKISVASDFVNPRLFVKAVKDIANYDDRLKDGVKMLRSVFTGNEKHSTASNMLDPTLKQNDFSFADNYNHSPNFLPPLRATNIENAGNPQSNRDNQSQPNSNKNGLAGSFAAGAGAIFGNATSASVLTGGSAIAVSSSTSTAMALALAIASINNSSGTTTDPTKGPKPKNPDPEPNSPPPSRPPGSGPRSYIGPNSDPSGPSPYIRPNSDPSGPSPFIRPSNDPSGPSPYIRPSNDPSGPSPFIRPSNDPSGSKPSFALSFGLSPSPSTPNPEQLKIITSPAENNPLSEKLETSQQEQTKSNSRLYVPKSKLNSNWTDVKNPDQKIAQHGQYPSLADHNMSTQNLWTNENLQKQSMDAKEALFNPFTDKQAQNANFIGAPALVFNQIYAFHTGAMNYHLQKAKNRSRHPFMRSFLASSNKAYGDCNTSAASSPYNLIFSHGNSPTLMGIPPIYPEANKT